MDIDQEWENFMSSNYECDTYTPNNKFDVNTSDSEENVSADILSELDNVIKPSLTIISKLDILFVADVFK